MDAPSTAGPAPPAALATEPRAEELRVPSGLLYESSIPFKGSRKPDFLFFAKLKGKEELEYRGLFDGKTLGIISSMVRVA
jgi:hypothetical protein